MERTIFTLLKKFIISCVNYRTLHVKQPDVASGVRPETKPLPKWEIEHGRKEKISDLAGNRTHKLSYRKLFDFN